MKKLVITSFVLFILPSVALASQDTERLDKVVNRIVKAINDANWAQIQATFGKEMQNALPLEKTTAFFSGMVSQYGKIVKLDPARYEPPNRAIYPTHFERGFFDIRMNIDSNDNVTGFWLLPHTPDIPVVEKLQTHVSLPFKGKWLVFWGGDSKELNYHHDTPNQRFAFDFVGVNDEGKTHKGDGKTNEDYFAFGREVLAPADGNVIDVINGVKDNVPGSMNAYSALGNAVVIQHRENEVSVLAHFKLDSIKVKVGDKIIKGQLIGLCGNSGNSSEPHLHYHLQNTPIIQDGTGIKCLFQKITILKDGKEETRTDYSPVKGDIILTN